MAEEPPIIPRLPTPPSPLPTFRTEGLDPTRAYSNSSLGEWNLDETHKSGAGGVKHHKRKKNDEPTKPIVVVAYVVALYLIFQILTRTEDMDLFSPESSRSSFPRSHSPAMDLPQYAHLPYSFPPTPNLNMIQTPPIPTSSNDSTWIGFIFGLLVYPFYLLITLLSIPIPLILNILYLLKEALLLILHPIVSIIKIFYGGFIATPLGFLGGILSVFYPLFAFVGSIVGVGCLMGLSVGWIGKFLLDKILTWRKNLVIKSRLKREAKRNQLTKKQLDKLRLERLYEEFDRQFGSDYEQEQEQVQREQERERDRQKPKKQIKKKNESSQRSRTQVLDIGHSDLRGTRKDERRERELQLQSQQRRPSSSSSLDSHFPSYDSQSENEVENRRKHGAISSSSTNSSRSNSTIETITTPHLITRTHSQSITVYDNQGQGITRKNYRKSTMHDYTGQSGLGDGGFKANVNQARAGSGGSKGEPVVIGTRQRGVR